MGADVAAEEQFGPYLVFEQLGVGGMATVHRALERGIEGFERIVALKRLLPHLAADASFIKSFVREAKLASLLNHVNIVQIFELGRVATQYFISMEYIDGRDIRRILRHARKTSGLPPIDVTVGLLLQLCEALDYAHHKVDDSGHPMGLVHRDVSPSNVLVTHAGHVKVIDFGIAKAQSVQLRTQTGRVKGKLAYMAPEALAGKDLDARSDLFAVGVIAHELITARPLFASKNEYQTLMKVQRGEVTPPSTFNQGCPPELDAIVLRALARDPDERFSHAGELRDELHAMRKQYNLQSSDRDIASWLEWAFGVEAPGGSAGTAADHGHTDVDARAHPRHRTSRSLRRHDDDEAVDLAWGDHDEQGNGEPVVLDDVPDVSAKHLQHASALGADVRLDLDDLADDIPTPIPSHGRPTVDLKGRTTTAPVLPRHIARNKAAAARGSQAIPAEAGDSRTQVAVAAARPAPARGEGMASSAAEASAGIRSTVVPSRVRTITIPPRAIPSSSAAPRNLAAATLPPRVPATGDASRGVPLPVAQVRSGAVAGDASRGVPIPAPPSRGAGSPAESSRSGLLPVAPRRRAAVSTEPSQSGPLPIAPPRSAAVSTERSRSGPLPIAPPRSAAAASSEAPPGVPTSAAPSHSGASSPGSSRSRPGALELSQGIPVPIEPSYTGPPPVEPPRSAPDASDSSRAGRLPMSPRTLPSSSTPPRRRTITSPGTGTPPNDVAAALAPAPPGRDSQNDVITARAPKFALEDLGLAADTVPSMPAMRASESVGRFREPTVPRPEPAPPDDPAPPPREALRTGTGRTRLITPATALFAEPENDSTIVTTTVTTVAVGAHGMPRPSQTTISDGPPLRRRATLGRIAMIVVAFLLVSAATTAAALYLTREGDAPLELRPAAPAPPSKATGTIHFEIRPPDAAIRIDNKPVRAGSAGELEIEPGVQHQIEIHRAGYNTSLTSIEVAAGQTHQVQVSLVPLGAAVAAEATLVLGSTPGNLEIVVDGVVVGTTPDKPSTTGKLPLAAGRHTIALRANGVEVWSQGIEDARPAQVYEYHPKIQPSGSGSDPAPEPTVVPPPATADPSAPSSGDPATGTTPPSPLTPVASDPLPLPPVPPAPPSTTPVTVSPTAVTRVSGPPPRVTALPNVELPPKITAKLCIDDTGYVTSAEMITPLPPSTATEIVDTLRTWQYTPYRSEGVTRAACFPVTFRVK